MPFRSTAQQKWAFATGQPFAKRWADETDFGALPKRARFKLRRIRVKAWSAAARAAALAKRRANAAARGSVSSARSEASHIRAAGDAAARRIRAAGSKRAARAGRKRGGGKGRGGGRQSAAERLTAQLERERRSEERYQAHHAQSRAERAMDRQMREIERAARDRAKPKKGGGGKGKKPTAPKPTLPQALLDSVARLSSGAALTPADQDALIRNGLAKLGKDGKPLLTSAGQRALLAQQSHKAAGGFAVFKDAGGAWRWLSVSSSAYRDRDGEIVSTKALENAVAIADATGFRGPLRWWHCGVPFGPGLDLGDCDFQATHGRFLVESGTFKSEAIALAFKETDDEVSIGFTHPPGAPDMRGVFDDVPIVIFERSLAPRGRVSNLFTSFTTTKEAPMDAVKTAALKERIGDDLLASLLGGVETTDKAAQDAKIAYKTVSDAPDAAALVAALKADPSLLATALKALGDVVAEAAPPPVDAAPDAAPDGDEAVEPDGDEMMLTPAECDMIADAVVQKIMPLLDIEKKMAGHAADIKTAMGQMVGGMAAQKDATQADQQAKIAELQATLKTTQARLDELMGDQPAAAKRGFKASESAATVIADTHPLAQQQPSGDAALQQGLDTFLSQFVLNGGQPAAS